MRLFCLLAALTGLSCRRKQRILPRMLTLHSGARRPRPARQRRCIEIVASVAALAALAGAAGATHAAEPAETSGRRFTAEQLFGLARVSEPHLSPDGTRIAFDLRTTQLSANKAEHAIWLIAGGGAHPLMPNASLPQWSADGTHVLALSDRSGSMQVWQVSIDGLRVRQVTHLPLDVQAFRVSPDGRRLIVSLAIAPGCRTAACTADRQRARSRDKSTGVLYDRLFVRHWDLWADGTRNHLFAIALDGAAAGPSR